MAACSGHFENVGEASQPSGEHGGRSKGGKRGGIHADMKKAA
jgi:hypothetical protein